MINCLTWNMRGIADAASFRRLKRLVKVHKIHLLVILEPMVDNSKLLNFQLSLQFHGSCCNTAGKIWCFWMDSFQCSITLNHDQCLNLHCKSGELEEGFMFSAIYAKCSKVERRSLWDSLISLSSTSLPWILGGDFNIVRRAHERLGGRDIDFSAAVEFNDCINSCGLVEPNFVGSQFTWKRANQRLWKRLDRMLHNVAWGNFFTECKVQHLNREGSDHAPLLTICWEGRGSSGLFLVPIYGGKTS